MIDIYSFIPKMKISLTTFLMFFITYQGFMQGAEPEKTFESVFYEVAVHVSSRDPIRALHIADSLYAYASNSNQKIKALMLSADILEKQEKRKEGIDYAMKALKIAEESDDYSFQSRIYGFMSTQYRQLGFSDKGKEYIQKGLEISENIKDKRQVMKFQAMAHHELGDYAIAENNYNEAIDYLNMALLGYEKEENEMLRYFTTGNIEESLGRSNFGLNEQAKSLAHFSRANNLINKSGAGNTIWAAKIYQGLGETFLIAKTLDSAGIYLKKALHIAEETNNGSLKELVFESMAGYYKEKGEIDSLAVFTKKASDISKENSSMKNKMINSEFNRATAVTEKKSSILLYLIIAIVLIVLAGLFTMFYKKKKPHFKIEDIKNEQGAASSVVMRKKTQEDLARNLKEFEKNLQFLDKDMSFSHMAGLLNTNAKYLSHYLKNTKNKDYNTYINDLRIQYLVQKLDTQEEYLNYKISYLAHECGFSSHSNFSANFKRVMLLSPSEYISKASKSEK